MFHQITLLCLGAILNPASNYARSPAQAYKRIGNQLRYNTPNRYLKRDGRDMRSSEFQLHDPARIYEETGNYRKSHEWSVFPREGSDVHKQGTTGYNGQRRNQMLKQGRGLMLDVIKSIGYVLGKTGERLGKAISWVTTKTIQIGKVLVHVPIQGVELTINAAWAAQTLGAGLTAQIISDTAEWFQGNWEAVKTVEFPGKSLVVMLYPSGLMSVVNRLTEEIMYMMDKAHKMLTHVFAYTLYVSLKIVFDSVNSAMKLGKLNCIKLTPGKFTINNPLVKKISFTGGKACGVSHLKPLNNVTVTRNDKKFLIATTPWKLEDLSVHLTGVTVDGVGMIGTVIEKENMDIKVKSVYATGTVKFEAGTLLRFVRISLKVDSIQRLKVHFPTKKKNRYMGIVEGMASDLSFLVTHEINKLFHTLEEKIYTYIANL